MFHIFAHMLSKQSKTRRFLIYHFGAILLFALLYWGQNLFLTKYPELSKKMGMGKSDGTKSMSYWLYFSALTQTTVGYSAQFNSKGDVIAYDDLQNNIYKLINMVQLFSIFWISATLIK